MEDIVAVAVELENGETRYFLTWGRIQSAVDPAPLERIVLEESPRFDLRSKAIKARLCYSLQEASQEAGFYECFFDMCQRKIPFGKTTYPKWRAGMNRRMRMGHELWYLWHGD